MNQTELTALAKELDLRSFMAESLDDTEAMDAAARVVRAMAKLDEIAGRPPDRVVTIRKNEHLVLLSSRGGNSYADTLIECVEAAK